MKDPFAKPGKPVPKKPKRKGTSKLDSPDLTDPFGKNASLAVAGVAGLPPASVMVDGRKVGKTPVPKVRVVAGSHTVECAFPGGRSSTQRVFVKAGSRTIVRCQAPKD